VSLTAMPPPERMRCIRELAARLARQGFPLDEWDWRVKEWLKLGILAIPGAGGLRYEAQQDRRQARRQARSGIAYDDWLARCDRKRRVSVRFRRIVIQRARGRCAYCGVRVPDEYFEIDHVHPVRWGGRSTLRNLAAACSYCNRHKGQEDGWEPYGEVWALFVLADHGVLA